MNSSPLNPSRIRHNPSRLCDGFGFKLGCLARQANLRGRNPSQSVTNPSRPFCDGFRRRKFNNNSHFSLSLLNPSRCHAWVRAYAFARVRGGCDGFGVTDFTGTRRTARQRACRATLAHVASGGEGANKALPNAATQHAATRWPTCRVPNWQAKADQQPLQGGHALRATNSDIQVIPVHAVVADGQATVIDCHGRPLCRKWPLADLLGPLPLHIANQWRWCEAVRRMKARLDQRYQAASRTPWMTKAKSLAQAFKVRTRFRLPKPKGRQRFERYATTSWHSACERLAEQGYNRVRRHSRDGWIRWAHTVSNNHNKRKGGRYAHARYGNSQDDHGDD